MQFGWKIEWHVNGSQKIQEKSWGFIRVIEKRTGIKEQNRIQKNALLRKKKFK